MCKNYYICTTKKYENFTILSKLQCHNVLMLIYHKIPAFLRQKITKFQSFLG